MKQELLRKIGLWILTASLIAAHIFFRSQAHAGGFEWKGMPTQSQDSQIQFPTPPQIVKKKLPLKDSDQFLIYTIYLAPYQKSSICLLLEAQYPTEIAEGSEKQGLDALLQGILSQFSENHIVFFESRQTQGFPTIHFLIESAESFFRAEAIMAKNRLFLIAIEGKKDVYDEAVFQQFFQSFSITQKP